ncbi:hypothetical protein [Aeromonas sanarellii]
MKKIFQIAIVFIMLAVFIFGIFFVLMRTWDVFKSINPTLATGIIAASATIFVSVATVMISKRQEQKLEIATQLRQKRVPVYEKIIEFIFLLTFATKLGKKPPAEKEVMQFFVDTTRELVIWGSNDMVKAFGDFRFAMMSIADQADTALTLAAVEDLLFAVRKDLGHNSKVKRGDILRLYINDLKDYFPQV